MLNDLVVTYPSLTLKVIATTKVLALGGTPLSSLGGDHTFHTVQGCKTEQRREGRLLVRGFYRALPATRF